jgi:CDP-diacylglycerol--serine O-phosphatidyltransferase
MRFTVGPLGIKDLFTLVNLLGGLFGILFVMEGEPLLAGYAVLAGYLVGDTLDGPVARLTRTANRFGSELDTATDHFVQAIVPGIIVFQVYSTHGHRVAGFVLMGVTIACATVRQALFTVARIGNPLIWCGLPRTVSGFACMSLVLAHTFRQAGEAAFPVGEVLIPMLSIMGLLPIPYMTHRGLRRMQTYVKLLILGFFVTPVLAFLVSRDYVFDVLFVWTYGYAGTAWFPIYPDERKAFFARYREWAAEVSK